MATRLTQRPRTLPALWVACRDRASADASPREALAPWKLPLPRLPAVQTKQGRLTRTHRALPSAPWKHTSAGGGLAPAVHCNSLSAPGGTIGEIPPVLSARVSYKRPTGMAVCTAADSESSSNGVPAAVHRPIGLKARGDGFPEKMARPCATSISAKSSVSEDGRRGCLPSSNNCICCSRSGRQLVTGRHRGR